MSSLLAKQFPSSLPSYPAISDRMPLSRSASASVIAAAVVAILESLFILLGSVVGFFGVLMNGAQVAADAFPSYIRTFALLITAFFVALSVFGIVTGICALRLRTWARISILIWGGLSLFFGVFGAFVAFLTPMPGSPGMPALPVGTDQLLRITLLVIYGLPALIGIWWLTLFNTKNVKEQFSFASPDPGIQDPLQAVPLSQLSVADGQQPTSVATSPVPAKSRPPIFVSILAWLYITSAAHVLLVPFLPFSLPIFLFGHFFTGLAGTAIYVCLSAIAVTLGAGLLKLKPWSYDSVIGLQIFFFASNAVTFFSSNYQTKMAELYQQILSTMHFPTDLIAVPDFSQSRWPIFFSLLLSAAVVAALLYYRRAFLAAARRS